LYEDVGDYTQADVWFRKSAEQGLAEAQFSLGVSYDLGQGVPQDYSQAASWYRKAAEQGYASAQWSCGKLYDTGLGVPQDYAEAYFWLTIAAMGKFEAPIMKDLTTERDNVAAHLTPADLSRVQERVRKWFASRPPHKGGRP
jgi:TPR repeat protein